MKKLARQKEAVKKKLRTPKDIEDFHKNLDSLTNLEVRERISGKKRSKKLGVSVPA